MFRSYDDNSMFVLARLGTLHACCGQALAGHVPCTACSQTGWSVLVAVCESK